jgi:hypothetical protein
MNTNWDDLIQRYQAGILDENETKLLQEGLKTDVDIRTLFLDHANLDAAMEVEAGTRESTRTLLLSPLEFNQPIHKRWINRGPAIAAAIGVTVGLLGASVAWAAALPWLAEIRGAVATVFTDKFETKGERTSPGLPTETTRWYGDEAVTVSEVEGVKPRSGSQMLQFLSATYAGENAQRSQWGDVYRLVDLRGLVGPKHTNARISASFAQSPVPEDTKFTCSVEGYALEVNQNALPSHPSLSWLRQHNSAAGSRMIPLTGNRTWQDLSIEIPVTQKTQFVLLHLAVTQRAPNLESGTTTFTHQFMDDVSVDLVTPR